MDAAEFKGMGPVPSKRGPLPAILVAPMGLAQSNGKEKMGMLRSSVFFGPAMVAALLLQMAPASADGACQPGVFLTIGGNVSKPNNAKTKTYDFTEDEFLKLGSREITTATPWTRTSTFKGPLLTDIISQAGASGKVMHLRALNDFTADLDIEEAKKYGAIGAYSMNGERLQVKDFGPVWAMFPRDAYPDELNTPSAISKYVWQICRIDVD
ncbi:molybdopterin-dependent oxidoreductase [Labrys sp. 22185]|uniref:molybdopterin-dependent oxidoreductase n=1 Tax=Labrys sp. 22185 TaxID=3453888 RepID=UPI003F860769